MRSFHNPDRSSLLAAVSYLSSLLYSTYLRHSSFCPGSNELKDIDIDIDIDNHKLNYAIAVTRFNPPE